MSRMRQVAFLVLGGAACWSGGCSRGEVNQPLPPASPPVSASPRPTAPATAPATQPATRPATAPATRPATSPAASPTPPATPPVSPTPTGVITPPATPPVSATPSTTAMDRAALKAAFEARLRFVFGGESGIQSPLGVRKLIAAWDQGVAPLLGDKLAEYQQRFPIELGGNENAKRKKKTVPPAVRQAVLARLVALFDESWGIADADLPRLTEILEASFLAAKNLPLPGATPPPDAGPVEADPSVERGPADGFGREATGGGAGAWRNVRPSAQDLAAVLSGRGNVRLGKGELDAPFGLLTVGSNTTLDGGGATLWYPGDNHNGKGLQVFGQNVIVRNLRVRNSGDGLMLGGASYDRTANVLLENISVTGHGDDGLSLSYNSHGVTVRWCLAAGNARACFIKYGGTDISIHHTIFTHYWIRGPLANNARIDLRNNLIQNWTFWGSRVEDGAAGNFVNNTWRESRWAGGKRDTALYASGASYYSEGNVFENCEPRPEGAASAPVVDAPPVPTEPAGEALARVLDEATGAGCMPRDAVDREYLACERRCPGGDPAHGLQVPGSRLYREGEPTPSAVPTTEATGEAEGAD